MDSMPNFVCQVCWSITETFHKLYLKSEQSQKQYLDMAIVKREPDDGYLWPNNKEDIFVDEMRVDADQVKLEGKIDTYINGNRMNCNQKYKFLY